MALSELPPELVEIVASFLAQEPLAALVRTNRRLHLVLNARLYRENDRVLREAEKAYRQVYGDKGRVDGIMDYEVDRRLERAQSRHSLYWAARRGRESLFKKAQSLGINIHRPLFLIRACESNRIGVVKILLEEASYINEQDHYDGYGEGHGLRSALHEAATYADAEVVELLLENGANVNAVALDPNSRDTPLHRAASANRVKTARLLLAKGADLSAVDALGNTPFHTAVYSYMPGPSVAKLLLDNGAPLNIPGRYGKTALDLALRFDCWGLIDAIIQKGYSPPQFPQLSLSGALRARALHSAKLILERFPDTPLEFPDIEATLALAASSWCQTSTNRQFRLEVIRVALERGFKVDTKDHLRRTALHHACWVGDLALATLLISNGARLDARDSHNQTPTDLALRSFQCETTY
ncbi:ankyrin repeats (3 copies) domain-containing protein [Purpureocillium lavendulum]|uniref:Ankyrin repeats (3 copies) domain-containing protein n=1 Tax=Purpureocillium lavendulum TaxID=1247861 RepID=A0AB34FMH5_9HYPO|nr:ankyrin repeats (3 copies) domain-containing protein [Purpureocillium lavendulum]